MIGILADDRERNGSVVDRLRAHEEYLWSSSACRWAAICIDEILPIERKTLPDLVASIKDGRLFSQAHR